MCNDGGRYNLRFKLIHRDARDLRIQTHMCLSFQYYARLDSALHEFYNQGSGGGTLLAMLSRSRERLTFMRGCFANEISLKQSHDSYRCTNFKHRFKDTQENVSTEMCATHFHQYDLPQHDLPQMKHSQRSKMKQKVCSVPARTNFECWKQKWQMQ